MTDFRMENAGLAASAYAASVTNSDGTLTISPTVGAVVASLALSHANVWTGAQTIGNTTGVQLQAATGVLTFTGVGNTNNEVMTIDLESHNNEIWFETTSGVTTFTYNLPNRTLAQNGGTFRVFSTDAQAADLGGSIAFGGQANSTPGANIKTWAAIGGRKENSNNNDQAGYLHFGTRAVAGNVVEAIRISSTQLVGVGISTSLSARFSVLSTTEQVRVLFDTSNYYSTTVSSTGAVTFDAVGSGAKFNFSDVVNLPSIAATTTNGDIWQDSTQKTIGTFVDGIKQHFVGTIYTQTADKTVGNTVTETSIVGTGVGGLTLPANFFVAGKTIRITMSGVYSTVIVTGDTVTVKIKYGSTVLASKATTALVTGGTNLAWKSEALITCRSTGATGTVQVSGGLTYQVAGAAAIYDEINNGITTTTLDTTASALLDVTVTHGTADASNTVKSLVGSFEVIN